MTLHGLLRCAGHCLALGGAILVMAEGPARAQDSWTREQYTSENGLLQNRVHAMEVDTWGGLLIGTEGGLVRFDGENFRQIGIAAPEGLMPSRVLEILPVPGNAFVIRDAGSRLYLYKNNTLRPITADAPARKPLSRFAGAAVSMEMAVLAMDPDSTVEGKSDWPYGVRMVPLGGPKWCLRTTKELLVYDGRKLTGRIPIPEGKWSHLFALHGGIFIFDRSGHAYRVDIERQQVQLVNTTGFPPVETYEGQLGWRLNWGPNDHQVTMVTSQGVFLLDTGSDGLVANRTKAELPADCRVGALIWLNDGQTLAAGTDTKGLFVFRRNAMRSLVCDMASDGVNNAYFAQAPYGFDGVITSSRDLTRLFTPAGCSGSVPKVPRIEESAILRDREQRYWYGRSDTLFTFDPATAREQVVKPGLRPLCFLEAGNSIYIGTSKGIFKAAAGNVVQLIDINEKDLSMRPTALCITPQGTLWAATCAGVFEAGEDGGWKPVPGLEGQCARALALLDSGIYVGTYGNGAFLFSHGRVHRLPMDPEGFLSHVHAFMPDQAGFLWMSTNQGLFRMKRSDLMHWMADTTQSVYMAYYGKRAGIGNSEFNGGCSPAYIRTGGGWASFPTMDGLVWFQPEKIPDAYPLNPIILEGLTVDGRKLPQAPEHLLDWDHHEVVVDFSMAYWGTRENAKLEYRLAGDHPGRWLAVPPGQRELRFSTLPTGKSTLLIRKAGAAFRGNGNAVALRFVVPVPFYRASWFILLCIVAGGLLLAAILRLNAARLRRRNMQLERMVHARTGELVDSNAELRRSLEMKEMLVSIISHDIVTPLRFIARVSNGAANGLQTQDPERLGETLQDIARSSDKLHANAQGLLQWIKRQDGRIDLHIRNVAANPFVQDVLAMDNERAAEKGIQLLNQVPVDDVLLTDRNVLSIVLHNLVANAVTHTAQGRVSVSGMAEPNGYSITVADTGSGMPESALAHAKRVQGKGALGAMNEEGERDVQGLGLLIVADLLQILGGSFTVESTRGKGTAVMVFLPQVPENAAKKPDTSLAIPQPMP